MPKTTDKNSTGSISIIGGNSNIMRSRKFSLLFAVAGTLMLTAAFAPRAEATATELLYYFDFNLEADNTPPPFTSRAPGSIDGTFPLRQTTLFNGQAGLNLFTGVGAGAGATAQTNTGTLVNAFDSDTAGGALRLRSNTTTATDLNCFTIGPMDFSGISGLQKVSISFALLGGGAGGFTGLTLAYSFNNTTFTNFATFSNIQNLSTYTTETADLPTAVNGQSTVYVGFCFSGSTNTGVSTATFIDNIQVNAVVPEPSTYIGGLLGILGLCWCQRQWLTRFLRLRQA